MAYFGTQSTAAFGVVARLVGVVAARFTVVAAAAAAGLAPIIDDGLLHRSRDPSRNRLPLRRFHFGHGGLVGSRRRNLNRRNLVGDRWSRSLRHHGR